MLRLNEIRLPLKHSEDDIRRAVLKRLKIADAELKSISVFKQGHDTRKRQSIVCVYALDVETSKNETILAQFGENSQVRKSPDTTYHFVAQAPENLKERPIIVGTGPCGLFAGLLLAQMGFKPIILERGKKVRERTADVFGFWRGKPLDFESNVQFGEGGAGTFSDGKLYTQIKDKKHYGRKVLQELVESGANSEILYKSRAHLGTYKLVMIVESLRQRISDLGGEIRFESRVDEVLIEDKKTVGIVLADGAKIYSKHIMLGIGHSARDTFYMLHEKGVFIEPKAFSIGFRIEHPQSLINKFRYGNEKGLLELGAADYKLIHHSKKNRSVYSFCMCPGGVVVASSSEEGKVVTNGMSQYSRAEANANSGIVVSITPEKDFPDGPLAGIELQRKWEELAFEIAGENYNAPAQLVGDFLKNKPSKKLGKTHPSYKPNITLGNLNDCLPKYAVDAIREALPAFGKKIKGFDMYDALLTGVETRTSSPIRMTRNEFYESVNTKGLYPAGEGAGYSGGILSSAIDGIKVAEAIACDLIKIK